MTGKRMDPERLAALYDLVPTTPPGFGLLHLSHADLRELLGDRDHQEAETESLRGVIAEREAERRSAMNATHEREDLERRELALALGLVPRGETVLGLLVHVRTQLKAAELKAKRWRSQCPAKASDVDGDITAGARAWAFASGFKRPSWWNPRMDVHLGEENDDWFVAVEDSTDEGVMARGSTPQQRVADLANWATAYVDACPLDILDEMAAATPGGDQ